MGWRGGVGRVCRIGGRSGWQVRALGQGRSERGRGARGRRLGRRSSGGGAGGGEAYLRGWSGRWSALSLRRACRAVVACVPGSATGVSRCRCVVGDGRVELSLRRACRWLDRVEEVGDGRVCGMNSSIFLQISAKTTREFSTGQTLYFNFSCSRAYTPWKQNCRVCCVLVDTLC